MSELEQMRQDIKNKCSDIEATTSEFLSALLDSKEVVYSCPSILTLLKRIHIGTGLVIHELCKRQ